MDYNLPNFFDGELRAKELTSDIDYEGVGNYVFIYADELDGFVRQIQPFSAKSVTSINALIIYEFLNSNDNVEQFVERTRRALMRILNSDHNRDYLFRYHINRLSEVAHVSQFIKTVNPELDWVFYFLRDENPGVLEQCMRLTNLNMDFLWRGKLAGRYVFQPIVPTD